MSLKLLRALHSCRFFKLAARPAPGRHRHLKAAAWTLLGTRIVTNPIAQLAPGQSHRVDPHSVSVLKLPRRLQSGPEGGRQFRKGRRWPGLACLQPSWQRVGGACGCSGAEPWEARTPECYRCGYIVFRVSAVLEYCKHLFKCHYIRFFKSSWEEYTVKMLHSKV